LAGVFRSSRRDSISKEEPENERLEAIEEEEKKPNARA